jgi:hypothetical protein
MCNFAVLDQAERSAESSIPQRQGKALAKDGDVMFFKFNV